MTMTVRDGALVIDHHHHLLRVEAWGRDALRVRATRQAALRDDLPQALLPQGGPPAEIRIAGGVATVVNGRIEAIVDAQRIRIRDRVADRMLVEEVHPARTWTSRGPGGPDHLLLNLRAWPDERCYGLGQRRHGLLDQKGCVLELRQRNAEVCIPFLLSSRGYGFLWNHPGNGRVELARNHTRWVAEACRQLDWWVCAGATPKDILARYAEATGRPSPLPRWALGFWQSRLRYANQDELLAVAREHVEGRKLPLSVIAIDYFHWPMMGEWRFDPQAWPDPAGMARELARLGIRALISVWPAVNAKAPAAAEMAAKGFLITAERGEPVFKRIWDQPHREREFVHFYDPSHPGARQHIWDRVKAGYADHGHRLFWLDACEPQFATMHHDQFRMHLGNGDEIGCAYPWFHQQAFFDGLRSIGEPAPLTLARSAWAGSQRFGAAVWSGDIDSTWDDLRQQVRAGLNIACSGIPWWTTDIGGFNHGRTGDPAFHELLVRWFQYGTFCPLMRLHGSRLPCTAFEGAPNEVWSYGPECEAIFRTHLLLRERLRAYLERLAAEAETSGIPPMRPLFLEFPADPGAVAVDDQFMLGSDCLVAPVLEAGARERIVHLPIGVDWEDGWTGQRFGGGRTITVDAPLERCPVFVRVGSGLRIRA